MLRTLMLTLLAAAPLLAGCSSGTTPKPRGDLTWKSSIRWEEGNGPDAREHGVMVLDEAQDRVLLFGGSGYDPQLRPLNDLWEFDLETRTWKELSPAGELPSGGGSRRAAVVPQRREAYLFGGYDERQQPNNELFRMSFEGGPVTFTRIEQENAPPGRLLHAFVYDPGHDRFILHAGVGAGGFYDDTWIMRLVDGKAVWTELDLEEKPSARYGSAYAYNASAPQLIVFSGADQRFPDDGPNDTWGLDLRGDAPNWMPLHQPAAGESLLSRRNPLWVWDESASRLIVWGGTADGRTAVPELLVFEPAAPANGWKRLELADAPDLRASGFGFHDPSRRESWMGFGNFREAYRDLNALGD